MLIIISATPSRGFIKRRMPIEALAASDHLGLALQARQTLML